MKRTLNRLPEKKLIDFNYEVKLIFTGTINGESEDEVIQEIIESMEDEFDITPARDEITLKECKYQ
jgi:hypothetical protein